MSKVVIQGDVNGTGIFTVAAPNSNSNRSLTLPDAAGTLDRLERSGNVLQVATTTLDGVISGGTSGIPSTITNGVQVFSLSFTPIYASSLILVQTSTITSMEESNSGDNLWLALWDGSTFISASSGQAAYNHWTSALNVAMNSLNISYAAGSTATRTIQVRAGINSGTVYVNGNSIGNYSGSSARVQMTVMEIAG